MRSELFVLAAGLVAKEEPFALATVVRRQPASSAQAGDGALITADGAFHGWLGGSCTQPTVVRESLKAIADGAPRLIALAPDPQTEKRPGILVFPMTCHSGGSVDIYLEPVLPAPRLLVFGISPTAQALVRLAKNMGYTVDVVDPDAERAGFPDADRILTTLSSDEFAARPVSQRGRLFAVVATLGQHDEESTLTALGIEPAYLGVVASRKRFAQIRETLVARGASPHALDAIANPAGIDIGARAPEEVALSILAEIVRVRHAQGEQRATDTTGAPPVHEERDPVCGMTVEIAAARHRAEHAGRTYYFCCGGCRERFMAAPDRYVPAGVR
jgi:xanthine dehydrogenase accessory factor